MAAEDSNIVLVLLATPGAFAVGPVSSSEHLAAACKLAGGKLVEKSLLALRTFLVGHLLGWPVHAVENLVVNRIAFLLFPVLDDVSARYSFIHGILVKARELLSLDGDGPLFMLEFEVGRSVVLGCLPVSLGSSIHVDVLACPPVQQSVIPFVIILVAFNPFEFHLDGQGPESVLAVQQKIVVAIFGVGEVRCPKLFDHTLAVESDDNLACVQSIEFAEHLQHRNYAQDPSQFTSVCTLFLRSARYNVSTPDHLLVAIPFQNKS